jgi:hypothetical protein
MNKANEKAVDAIPTASRTKKDIIELDTVPASIMEEVDTYVEESASEKASKKAAGVAKKTILDFMENIVDEHGKSGNYQKSFRLPGSTTDGVTFTKAARFSIAKDTTPEEMAKVAGKKFVETNFEQEVSIAVNPEVLQDPKMTNKLITGLRKAFGEDLSKFFVQERKMVVAAGVDLASEMYNLPEKKRVALQDVVKQSAAGLK